MKSQHEYSREYSKKILWYIPLEYFIMEYFDEYSIESRSGRIQVGSSCWFGLSLVRPSCWVGPGWWVLDLVLDYESGRPNFRSWVGRILGRVLELRSSSFLRHFPHSSYGNEAWNEEKRFLPIWSYVVARVGRKMACKSWHPSLETRLSPSCFCVQHVKTT